MTLPTATREDGTANPSQAPCQSHQSDEAHAEASVGFSGLPTGLAEKTMIKIETIKDPCAEAVFQTRERDGTIVSQKFIFGEPQRVHETPSSDWNCPVMIEGLLPKIVPVMGISSADSFRNALNLVRTFRSTNARATSEL